MKTLNLLSGVAVTVLLGAGVALAQAPQAPEKAPAAQQNAPAEKMAPAMKAGEKKAPETTGQATPGTTSQSPGMKAEDAKPSTAGQAPSGADKAKSSSDMKSDKSASDSKMDSKSATDANKNDATKGAASTDQSTTGQGAAAGAAKLSAEQQTKITTTFKSAKIQSVPKSQLNVSIAVGTKLPSTLRFTPVPAEVVAVYPQWRGYYVILVDGQYIIVEPRTHEIVYIIV